MQKGSPQLAVILHQKQPHALAHDPLHSPGRLKFEP
jgi:hypothetical protein